MFRLSHILFQFIYYFESTEATRIADTVVVPINAFVLVNFLLNFNAIHSAFEFISFGLIQKKDRRVKKNSENTLMNFIIIRSKLLSDLHEHFVPFSHYTINMFFQLYA